MNRKECIALDQKFRDITGRLQEQGFSVKPKGSYEKASQAIRSDFDEQTMNNFLNTMEAQLTGKEPESEEAKNERIYQLKDALDTFDNFCKENPQVLQSIKMSAKKQKLGVAQLSLSDITGPVIRDKNKVKRRLYKESLEHNISWQTEMRGERTKRDEKIKTSTSTAKLKAMKTAQQSIKEKVQQEAKHMKELRAEKKNTQAALSAHGDFLKEMKRFVETERKKHGIKPHHPSVKRVFREHEKEHKGPDWAKGTSSTQTQGSLRSSMPDIKPLHPSVKRVLQGHEKERKGAEWAKGTSKTPTKGSLGSSISMPERKTPSPTGANEIPR